MTIKTALILLVTCLFAVETIAEAKTIRTKSGITYYDPIVLSEGPTWIRIRNGESVLNIQKRDILPESEKNNGGLLIVSVLVVINGLIMAYSNRLYRASLWVGRVIAEPELLAHKPEGYQDAITPRYQTGLQVAWILTGLAIFGLGTIAIGWYAGFAGVLCAVLISKIFGFLVPNTLQFYLKHLHHGMSNRLTDYVRDGDVLRAGACRDVVSSMGNLIVLIDSVVASSGVVLPVPNVFEAKNAHRGCLIPGV